MTLLELANITSASTLFQIVSNNNPEEIINAYAISIRTARANHHPVVARYVNDDIIFIDPSHTEPNIIHVIVDHKEDKHETN